MSGGSGNSIDPYYRPVAQGREKAATGDMVQPKRVDKDESGKSWYVYDCFSCGKEFRVDRRKKYATASCGEDCRRSAFGKLAVSRRGIPRTEAEKQAIGDGNRRAWKVPEIYKARTDGMKRAAAQRELRPKKPPQPARKYNHICPQCGRAFQSELKSQKYCSQVCNGASRRHGEFRKCANPGCENEFYKLASRPDRKYCCKECADADPGRWWGYSRTRSERRRKWEWTGWEEKRTDPYVWEPLAARVRKADGHRCQSCGRIHRSDEKAFSVHHIIPWSIGGPDEEWNLMTLCPRCHRKTDAQRGPVRFPDSHQEKLE